MLDMSLVRKNPDIIRAMLKKRNLEYPLDVLLDLDGKRRGLLISTQGLKRKRNIMSLEIAQMQKQKME